MKKTEEIYFLVYEYRIFYSVELKLYTFLFKKKDNIQNKPEEFTEYRILLSYYGTSKLP